MEGFYLLLGILINNLISLNLLDQLPILLLIWCLESAYWQSWNLYTFLEIQYRLWLMELLFVKGVIKGFFGWLLEFIIFSWGHVVGLFKLLLTWLNSLDVSVEIVKWWICCLMEIFWFIEFWNTCTETCLAMLWSRSWFLLRRMTVLNHKMTRIFFTYHSWMLACFTVTVVVQTLIRWTCHLTETAFTVKIWHFFLNVADKFHLSSHWISLPNLWYYSHRRFFFYHSQIVINI